VAYKIAKIGERLGTVYGETEKEALANVQKEFARTEAEKKRIYPQSAMMQYGRPNLNEGKDWSEMDLFDLRNSLAHARPSLRLTMLPFSLLASLVMTGSCQIRNLP
jgi:hypothetical protein